MKVYSSSDIKNLERHTVNSQNVNYAGLMERAIEEFSLWFLKKLDYNPGNILVIAGPGNNGGDAIGIAGRLDRKGYNVKLLCVNFNSTPTQLNTYQLKKYREELHIENWAPGDVIAFDQNYDNIIDGLFGYGLNRPIQGDILTFIKYFNELDASIYSIDIPSGISADLVPSGFSFRGDYTLTFHSPKPAFFLAKNAGAIREWDIAGIGLKEGGFKPETEVYRYFTRYNARDLLPERKRFDHKGSYGHDLLISGQYGMAGCAILAGIACLRTGAGKLTIHCPSSIYPILQMGLPEAMISVDCSLGSVSELPDMTGYDAIGVGPGIGTGKKTETFLKELIESAEVPLILDADALNIMSRWKNWQEYLKKDDVILPHPGEFDRLYGEHDSHLDRINTIEAERRKYPFTIVLKGAYTIVAQEDQLLSFNSSGNPGMGTAGSGDVLTGMITSLAGQGLNTYNAARLGVYLHGLAGDIYKDGADMSSLIARDLVKNIGKAIQEVERL